LLNSDACLTLVLDRAATINRLALDVLVVTQLGLQLSIILGTD